MGAVIAEGLLVAAILVVAALSLRFPSPGTALLLAVLSAAWLPINNGHLEGPVLIVVAHDHGLTTADLLAYAGFALALLAGWRWQRRQVRTGVDGAAVRWPAMAAFVAVLALLLGCGLAASWFGHGGRDSGSRATANSVLEQTPDVRWS